MPIEVYRQVESRKRRSVTEFVLQAVEEKIARERQEELQRGFETLAGSFDEEESRNFASAQREAMKRVDD